ncbi:MAG TPA: glycosyltransferase [Chitinophagaceae bacterium]|jgi:glycosyltransferase involved in cell wall biosynthesis|nr:glycosyltransferase [Chitinophagaceae bacterium]
MKIVHLSTFTAEGGAGIATLRIHKKLLEKGIHSDLLVYRSSDRSLPNVTEVKKDFIYRIKESLFYRLDNFFYRKKIRPGAHQFSFNRFKRVDVHDHPLIKQADIVCLYWVAANFLTPKQIGKINKPIIWRLSDKWAFTGGCHYSGDCIKYEEHCGNCPQLITNKEKDFTWFGLKRKYEEWKDKNITVVAPSNWIADAAGRSTILKDKSIIRIGTGVDHTIFRPINKAEARAALNIPTSSKVILFGANNALESTYKGGIFFRKMVERLADKEYIFLLFGSDKMQQIDVYKNVRFLGVLKEENDLCCAYNAADIFICPSTEDNLPNTVLESMACGTPCIAFRDSGGVVDAIDHKRNGYLAEFKNVNDLIGGINWIIEANKSGVVSENAIKKILQDFTLENQVNSLISLYESLLTSKVQKKKTTLF